jgi:hypothetical protein
VIKRFDDVFMQRDPAVLADLVADSCVMETAQPAPNGTRYEGYDACLRTFPPPKLVTATRIFAICYSRTRV